MNGVKLFGFDKVYGMISTYNHYRLLCTGKLNEETDNLEAIEKALEKLTGKLNEETDDLEAVKEGLKKPEDEENEVEEGTPSPEGKLIDFKKGIICSETNKATLFGSQIIPDLRNECNDTATAKKILQLLTLFILKACTTLTKLLEAGECEENSVYKQMPCRILNSKKKNEFAFSSLLLEQLKLNVYNPALQSIYVIHHLGSGASGNCCLGVSNRGESSCAVKFYHEAGKQETKVLAIEEFENWQNIYGEKDYGPPMARKWNLLVGHCLVMPYLKPVPKSERHKLLEAPEDGGRSRIEQTLINFAARGYIHKDIKWRHFGYWREDIFLLDLGFVARVEGINIDEWVNTALQYLRNSAGESEPALFPGRASQLVQRDQPETQENPKKTRKRKATVQSRTCEKPPSKVQRRSSRHKA